MDAVIENLRATLGRDSVLSEADELLVYECDGLPQHKHRPRAVVFPNSTEEVAEVLRVLAREGISFSPRGAGTGLSGGALAIGQGIIIELARMRRLLRIDTDNRIAVVQTGLVNAQLSRAALPFGLHYVPDPSSQTSCTIGGNIAENAGGIHCLKYGTTVDHVIAARVVLSGGDVVDLDLKTPGYDLLGVFIGSEGTFGIATEATVRLMPIPPAVRTLLAIFDDVNDASRAVSAIIAAGLVPAALEMMDGAIIRAVEASVFAAGLPQDAEAALLVELDGLEAELDETLARAKKICLEHRAREVRSAQDERERRKLWAARKGAFGAMGRISPDTMLQDAVVPRSRLPEVLAMTYRLGAKYNLRVANVFHAGDGNLHPFLCFDSRHPEEVLRVKEAGRELMETCVRAGGSITGEHGVGLDKSEFLPLIFSADDMDTMLRVRAAFDPTGLCNPGKIIPTSRSCGEARGAQKLKPRDAETQRDGNAGMQSVDNPKSELSDFKSEISNLKSEMKSVLASPHLSFSSQDSRATVSRKPVSENALAQIVGAENVASSNGYLDSSTHHVPASLVVSPASIEEACEVLRLAALEGWRVLLAGAGTWLDVGNRSDAVDLIISTSRLSRIIEHEPADLIAIAEAGVTLHSLNAELAHAGQWLPLDPPDDGRATIGGVAATGIAGAQSLAYGSPRNSVIGMRVALADGRMIKAGGRVVKNVAGYDLCKLFTGNYGTLGLILELTFKLRPLPAQTATVMARGALPSLLRAAHEISQAQLFPVALELISPRMATALAPDSREETYMLLIRFSGTTRAVADQRERTHALLRDDKGLKRIDVFETDARLWSEFAATPLLHEDKIIWRANVWPTELGPFLVDEENASAAFSSSTLWHAGLCNGSLRVMCEAKTEAGACIASLERLRNRAQNSGGALVIEHAPPEIKNEIDVWGDAGKAGPLMQRIKKQLDPAGTFSAGRFVAGI
ncbi:MAG: FAD-linked oxidase C-terminal domain-containing protein [Pyrinomonadaceae bacterium]